MSSNFVDEEAEREDDDKAQNFEDSSEEDEDIDHYEKDEFIVDDDEDINDDQDADDETPTAAEMLRQRKKEKRRRRSYSHELAEGDLQLLEEEGLHVNRKKKLRRLRKGASDDEDYDDDIRGMDDEYDDYDERVRDRRRVDDDNIDYDDDMDDFIDDGGRGRRRRAAERKGLVSSEAVRAARSIFGDADDMDHYKGSTDILNKSEAGDGQGFDDRGSDDFDNDDDDDFLAMDDEGGRRRPKRRSRGRGDDARTTESAIRAIAATTLDEESMLKPKVMERFVDPDIPERLIVHFGDDYSSPSGDTIKTESEWIYTYGFRHDPNCGAFQFQPENVKEKIAVFLQYLHRDKLDIPFIAMYRKDYITPELICEAGENPRGAGVPWNHSPAPRPHQVRGFNSYQYDGFQPGLSIEHLRGVEPGYDDGFGDWTTLWKIMDWDRKFNELNKRRKRLCDAADRAVDKGVPLPVTEQVKKEAMDSYNELQIADIERYLRQAVELSLAHRTFTHGEDGQDDDKRLRRPSRRKNKYADYCKKGYRGFCDYFGMSPRQFADNVHAGVTYGLTVQAIFATDAEDEPLEAARRFVRSIQEDNQEKVINMDKDPSRILAAARHILIRETSAELPVVQAARTILNKEGTVTVDTYPTPLGISEVDEAHPLRQVTFIAGKKIERLANTIEFSLIRHAVKLGYTKLTIKFQEEQVHHLSEILTKAFSSLPTGTVVADMWNAERKLVADGVLEELKHQIRSEIFTLLSDQSSETLKRQMTQSASRRLLLGPTRPNRHNDGAPKTLAICVTREEDEEPDKMQARRDLEEAAEKGRKTHGRRIALDRITFVVVDENGEYVSSEELFAGWLTRPFNKNPPDEVVNQLKVFIKRMKPEAIIVGLGSGGKSAIRLKDDIRYVLVEMLKTNQLEYMLTPEQQREFQEDVVQNQNMNTVYRFVDPYVTAIDEWPARFYARCKWSNVGLPVDGMTLLEKRALALGRLAQEPLTIYTSICSDPDVSSKLAMHRYHYHIKPFDRVQTLERALIRSVCTTGVDINRLLSLPHQKPMLQFVGGLGEHKAHSLLKSLEAAFSEEDKGLPSRKHLWTKDFMGRTVFMSAAAFLRVRDPELHPGGSTFKAVSHRKRIIERKSRRGRSHEPGIDLFYDPMDDSRIHPEHYAVAIKIADEALRDDEGQLSIELTESSEISVAMRVTSAVLDNPGGLRRLALDEYAEHLFKLRRGKLYETVKLIAREFHGTFADFRRPLVSPNSQAVFYMVTRASPLEFRIGSKVTATNCRLGNNMDCVLCWLPNNIRGLIDRREFSDESIEDEAFKNLVTEGSSLPCRVLNCEWDRFRVRLTSKPSLLKDPKGIVEYVELVNTGDDSYRPYPAQAEGIGLQGRHTQSVRDTDLLKPGSNADDMRRLKASRMRNRAKSVVNHRHFRDINGPAAVEALRNALPGDVIIRPSAYNKDSFVFSCKFAALENKDNAVPRDIFHIEFRIERDANDPETVNRLRIGTEDFDHIDEAMEQFLHPIIGNMKEALDYRKFRLGGEDELKKFVVKAKKENPRTIPYSVGLSEKRDLHLFIAYVPGQNTPRTEYIKVVPHGYRLRDVMHNNLETLTLWFKKNMSKGMTVRRPISRPGSVRREMPASPFASSAPPTRYGVIAGATRARDAPPPPAPPMSTARSPYIQPSRVMPPSSPFVGGTPSAAPTGQVAGREPDWNRAVRRDDPPPPVQNGRVPVPPPGNPFAMSAPRDMQPPPRDLPPPPPPPARDYPMHGPPPQRDVRGPPMHAHGAPPGRDGPPMRGSRHLRPPSPPRGPMDRGFPTGNGRPMPPAGRGMHHGGPGMPPGGRGMPPGGRGMPPGGRGMPPGGRGMPPGGRGMPPGGRGMPPGGRGMPPGARGAPTGGGRGRGSGRTIPAWKLKEMQEQGQQ